MSIIVPRYLVGKNLAKAYVQGVSFLPVTGELGYGQGADLSSKAGGERTFDEFRYSVSKNLTEETPQDATVENWVPNALGFDLVIGEIQKADGSARLTRIYNTFDYIRMEAVFSLGTDADAHRFVALATMDTLEQGLVEGKNAALLHCKPCGVSPFFDVYSEPVPF